MARFISMQCKLLLYPTKTEMCISRTRDALWFAVPTFPFLSLFSEKRTSDMRSHEQMCRKPIKSVEIGYSTWKDESGEGKTASGGRSIYTRRWDKVKSVHLSSLRNRIRLSL